MRLSRVEKTAHLKYQMALGAMLRDDAILGTMVGAVATTDSLYEGHYLVAAACFVPGLYLTNKMYSYFRSTANTKAQLDAMGDVDVGRNTTIAYVDEDEKRVTYGEGLWNMFESNMKHALYKSIIAAPILLIAMEPNSIINLPLLSMGAGLVAGVLKNGFDGIRCRLELESLE
jgi:hypothetical protein